MLARRTSASQRRSAIIVASFMGAAYSSAPKGRLAGCTTAQPRACRLCHGRNLQCFLSPSGRQAGLKHCSCRSRGYGPSCRSKHSIVYFAQPIILKQFAYYLANIVAELEVNRRTFDLRGFEPCAGAPLLNPEKASLVEEWPKKPLRNEKSVRSLVVGHEEALRTK